MNLKQKLEHIYGTKSNIKRLIEITSRHRCFKDGMAALRDAIGTLVLKQ